MIILKAVLILREHKAGMRLHSSITWSVAHTHTSIHFN
jgi:hypothetical protein